MLSSEWGRAGWDPFAEMRRLQAEMNQLFEGAGAFRARRGYPPVNLWLGENSVVITAELPGLSSDEIDLTVVEDSLTIRGEHKPAASEEQAVWRRRERPTGPFARTVELPFRVDPDRVQARVVNGVLEVELRRPEADAPRKIQVQAS